MRVYSAVKRWSKFLDGAPSVVGAAVLATYRAATSIAPPGVTVPLRLKGQTDPVYCRPGTSDFHTLLQLWDQDEYRHAAELIEDPPRTVIDLGSNIGLSVRYFAELWPDARILAVEPDPENAAVARLNLAGLIREGRVELWNCFVGAQPGFAAPVREEGKGHNEIRMGSRQRVSGEGGVPVKTMPELLDVFAEGSIDFLKCDIEGSERMLLDGGPEWLRRVEALVVELHGIQPQWLWNSLRDAGVGVAEQRVQPVVGYDFSVVWARLYGD